MTPGERQPEPVLGGLAEGEFDRFTA